MPINTQVSVVCNLVNRDNNPPLVGISQHLVLLMFIMHKSSTNLSENTSLALANTYLQEHIMVLAWVRMM